MAEGQYGDSLLQSVSIYDETVLGPRPSEQETRETLDRLREEGAVADLAAYTAIDLHITPRVLDDNYPHDTCILSITIYTHLSEWVTAGRWPDEISEDTRAYFTVMDRQRREKNFNNWYQHFYHGQQ